MEIGIYKIQVYLRQYLFSTFINIAKLLKNELKLIQVS